MSESNPQLTTPPPQTATYHLTYPAPHILLITINRPQALNSLPYAAHWEADALFSWFDAEPTLRVAVVTGAGTKAFCAGQDLIEQNEIHARLRRGDKLDARLLQHPRSGFMGISRREGRKPVIAAVRGYAMGGGFEICLNCDMVVAGPDAKFGLPEAQRGLYAAAGGLSRIVRICGLPVASDIALAGRVLSAQEAASYHLVNRVSAAPESCVDEAVELAKRVASVSPDAAIVTRHGLRESLEEGNVERASQRTETRYGEAMRRGDNIRIGLAAFAKKEEPAWVPSKL